MCGFLFERNLNKKQEQVTIRYRSPPQTNIFSEFSEARRISAAPSRKGYWEKRENKVAMWYLRIFIEMVWGVEAPCNGSYASLLCFECLSSKISIQNVRKEMANFAPGTRGSKQNKMFVLFKQLTALPSSNRRPRIFKHVYRTTFSSNCIVS